MEPKKQNDMIKATGLWENRSDGGVTYLSGSLGGIRVLIFQNKFKTEENHPSYILYFAPNEERPKAEKPAPIETKKPGFIR